MIRIRFHGRGGHGIKTASRVAGSAAFVAGYQVQDSPVYGAERRGAAVTAFTRISEEPILERGRIEHPSLLVLADETLLDDPAAGVLAGQEAAAAIFINTAEAEPLLARHQLVPPVVAFDVTGRTLQILGRASALSAGLGAAAARLTGLIDEAQLVSALVDEFEQLELPSQIIDRNRQLAIEVFRALQPCRLRPAEVEAGQQPLTRVGYDHPLRGTPSIVEPANAAARKTGSWRVERPVIDRDICTRCGLCVVRCPDGAIALDEEGYPVIDYDHCKGCMICRHECPVLAVQGQKETRAW